MAQSGRRQTIRGSLPKTSLEASAVRQSGLSSVQDGTRSVGNRFAGFVFYFFELSFLSQLVQLENHADELGNRSRVLLLEHLDVFLGSDALSIRVDPAFDDDANRSRLFRWAFVGFQELDHVLGWQGAEAKRAAPSGRIDITDVIDRFDILWREIFSFAHKLARPLGESRRYGNRMCPPLGRMLTVASRPPSTGAVGAILVTNPENCHVAPSGNVRR